MLLGTFGVGLVSQVFNFNSFFIAFAILGVPMGLTKYVSKKEKDGDTKGISDVVFKFSIIISSICILLLVITLLFSREISFLILDNVEYNILLVMVAIALPFSALSLIYDAVVRGMKLFGQYVKIAVLNSIISIIVSVLGVLIWGLYGATLSLLVSAIISTVIYIFFLIKKKIIVLGDVSFKESFISKPIIEILKIGFVGTIDLIVINVTLLLLRSIIIRDLGVDANGVYQTIYAISNNYLSIFFMSLWVYILPTLSEMKNLAQINNELNNALRLTVLIISPIIAIVFVFRHAVINLLFSVQFIPAADYIVYNFIGDFLKASSWAIGAWYIPRGKLKLWLSLGLSFNLSYFLIAIFLLNYIFNDLRSIVISYACANLIHFVINLFFSRKVNEFRINSRVFKTFVATLFMITVIFIVSSINIIYGYVSILPILLIWFSFSISKVELSKTMKFLKRS